VNQRAAGVAGVKVSRKRLRQLLEWDHAGDDALEVAGRKVSGQPLPQRQPRRSRVGQSVGTSTVLERSEARSRRCTRATSGASAASAPTRGMSECTKSAVKAPPRGSGSGAPGGQPHTCANRKPK
jgi:hypothetical protein